MAKPVYARYNGEEIPVDTAGGVTPRLFGEVLSEEFPELANSTVRVSETDDATYWDFAVTAGNKG